MVEISDEHSRFCIISALADMLGLKEENRRLLGPVRQCLKLNTTHGKVTYSLDNQSLLVTLPQVWIEYQNLA